MQVATVQNQQVRLTKSGWALLLAIVAIVPALVTAGIDLFLTRPATIRMETAKLDLEREKAATALFQGALATTEPIKRKELLVFLVDVGVLNDEHNVIRDRPPDQIPQWTSTASASGP